MAGHQLFDLSGARGYVTGSGSGLGREIAIGLAEAGAAVVVSDINFSAAEEVANAVRFLSSREASFISGTVLAVNGGYTTGKDG